jgi:hypothetical protein
MEVIGTRNKVTNVAGSDLIALKALAVHCLNAHSFGSVCCTTRYRRLLAVAEITRMKLKIAHKSFLCLLSTFQLIAYSFPRALVANDTPYNADTQSSSDLCICVLLFSQGANLLNALIILSYIKSLSRNAPVKIALFLLSRCELRITGMVWTERE